MSIRTESGQDGSVTEIRRALQYFTNRRSSIRQFAGYVNDDPAMESILFFHGDGGNGKTLLLRYLKEKCCKRLDVGNWEYVKSLGGDDFINNFVNATGCTEIPSTLIDFAMEPRGEYRPKESFSALIRMRKDLAGAGLRFPLYDFACILYLHKTGRLTKDKLREFFPQEEMDFVTEAISLIEEIPGAGLAKAAFGLFNKRLREKFTLYMSSRKIDEEKVQEMKNMDPEADLYPMFPTLFAEDLNTSMTLDGAPPRVVLFFDGHESFWEVSGRRFTDEKYFLGDAWLRQLLTSLELGRGVITIIAGREEPKWSNATRERIAAEYIHNHMLGGLLQDDAALYLEKIGINDQAIKENLLAYTQIGTGEIHPLYLGLCADIVLAAKNNRKEIVVEDFSDIPEASLKSKQLMSRLSKYIDKQTMYAISALSACRSFDKDLYVKLMEALKIATSTENFAYLTEFSFIWDSEERGEGWYRVHDLMRRLANEQGDPTTQEAHRFLVQYYHARAEQGDLPSIAEEIYHTIRLDPASGIGQWIVEMEKALNYSKYDLCRVLLGIRNELVFYNHNDSGRVSVLEGNYYYDLSVYENALIEYEEGIAAFDEALRKTPDDAMIHNNKGGALASLGGVLKDLSRHEEATEIYSRAIAAFDEALLRAPDDIEARTNKGLALGRFGNLQTSISRHNQAIESYIRAIATFDGALLKAPDYVHAHNNKGHSLIGLGSVQVTLSLHEAAAVSYRQAIVAFDEALLRAPDDVYTYNNKGLALGGVAALHEAHLQHEEAEERYGQANAAYDEVLHRAPDDLYAYNNRGSNLVSLGNMQVKLFRYEEAKEYYNQAIAAFNGALSRAPDYLNALNNKGLTYGLFGELHAVQSEHEEAMKSYEQAIVVCDEALRRAPAHVSAHNNRGMALKRLGDLQAEFSRHEKALESYDRAIAAFNEALNIAPDDVNTLNNKGEALIGLGDLQEKLSLYEEVAESYSRAIAAFDRALHRAPNYLKAHNNKGMVLGNLGELQMNLSRYEEALESFDQAITSYAEVLVREPDNVRALNNKGIMHVLLGYMQLELSSEEEAAESYARAVALFSRSLEIAPAQEKICNMRDELQQRI